ncbi:MAG: hypothetical protein PHF50_01275 [Patescibacteria group bacterium]|nr:hypothetical protein [Patescibacteria group bacterium]
MAENKIIKIANNEAKFRLKFSVSIIGSAVKISKHGRTIIRRSKPSFGFKAVTVKIKNKIKRSILNIPSRSASRKKQVKSSPADRTIIRFLLLDI